MLSFLEKNKDKGKFYILTSETIQDDPNIANKLNVFTNIFSAAKIGLIKTNPEIYKHVANIIDAPVNEIIFIDDSQNNIDAAQKAGLNTILYIDNQSLIDKLRSIDFG